MHACNSGSFNLLANEAASSYALNDVANKTIATAQQEKVADFLDKFLPPLWALFTHQIIVAIYYLHMEARFKIKEEQYPKRMDRKVKG